MCLCRLRLLVLAAALLFIAVQLPTSVYATTIHVPSGQPTIEAGLNAANTGDTVMVAPGLYNEALVWPFKNGIVLVGSGLDSTIVVGNGVEPVILMVKVVPIDTSTVVRGLRLTNGGDAGIALNGVSPIVTWCAVDSTRNGPGIYCYNGSGAVIRNCWVTHSNNRGIRLENCASTAVIAWNTISCTEL